MRRFPTIIATVACLGGMPVEGSASPDAAAAPYELSALYTADALWNVHGGRQEADFTGEFLANTLDATHQFTIGEFTGGGTVSGGGAVFELNGSGAPRLLDSIGTGSGT